MDKKPGKKSTLAVKQKLEQEKVKILRQIDELKLEDPFSDPAHATDNAAVDTDVREQVGHEIIEAQIKDLQRRVSDIDIAIKRIQKKKYGICERCALTIPHARLDLIPEARFCVECEKRLRK